MASKLVECPRCGSQNDAVAETCAHCGIDLEWMTKYAKHGGGPPSPDSPLILIVDDEVGALTLIGLMLSRAGYWVAKAKDAYEALQIVPSLRPDLIITNVMMPGMDGIELTRRLKTSPATLNIPVYILTARGDPEAVNQGIAAGAMRYITKPILHHYLIRVVTSVLRGSPLILCSRDHVSQGLSEALYERHVCVLTGSPSHYLHQAIALKPDGIVLPFHIEDTSGLDILAQLKAAPDVASIPVLMLADSPEPELERQAIAQGAYGVYTGPLDADRLLAALPPLAPRESGQSE